jgi:hypothetical protein
MGTLQLECEALSISVNLALVLRTEEKSVWTDVFDMVPHFEK